MTASTTRGDPLLIEEIIATNARADSGSLDKTASVTLTAHGMLVSGSLVPAWQYRAELLDPGETGPSEMEAFLSTLLAQQEEPTPAQRELFDEHAPRYAHLLGHYFVGALALPPAPSTDPMTLIRVDLASVDAWSPTSYSPPPSEDHCAEHSRLQVLRYPVDA